MKFDTIEITPHAFSRYRTRFNSYNDSNKTITNKILNYLNSSKKVKPKRNKVAINRIFNNGLKAANYYLYNDMIIVLNEGNNKMLSIYTSSPKEWIETRI